MSGEDDLRAIVTCSCAEGPYYGAQRMGDPLTCERCRRMTREQYDAIATPAEPARESDGVRLTEDEREALGSIRIAQGDLDAYGATWRVAEVVEKLIAARVAEAGARALEEAADEMYAVFMSGRLLGTASDIWLRDRARGLGGAS